MGISTNCKNINTDVITIDDLWALISAQPKRIRKALSLRLQQELSDEQKSVSGVDKALEDVKKGYISKPFDSADELFLHLGI